MTNRLEAPGWIGMLLGLWQFASKLLWQHSSQQFMNAQVVAVALTAFSAATLGLPGMRYANVLVAIWLFASAWILPRLADATLWNNVLVASAMLAVALHPAFAVEQNERARGFDPRC